MVDSTVDDHMSILATVKELCNLPHFLTERDRMANAVSRDLRDSARDDAPRSLARPSEHTADAFHADSAVAAMTLEHVSEDMAAGEAPSAPLSEFQSSLVSAANAIQALGLPRLGVLGLTKVVGSEHDGAAHVRAAAARILDLP